MTNTNDRDYLVRQPEQAEQPTVVLSSKAHSTLSGVWWSVWMGGRGAGQVLWRIFYEKKNNRKRGLCVVLGLALILLTPHLSKEARQKG